MFEPSLHSAFWTTAAEVSRAFPGGNPTPSTHRALWMAFPLWGHVFPRLAVTVVPDPGCRRTNIVLACDMPGNTTPGKWSYTLDAGNPNWEGLRKWLTAFREEVVRQCVRVLTWSGYDTPLPLPTTNYEAPTFSLGTDLLGEPGSLTILGGSTGVGKTLMLMRVIYDFAAMRQKPVRVFLGDEVPGVWGERLTRTFPDLDSALKPIAATTLHGPDTNPLMDVLPTMPEGTLVVLDHPHPYRDFDWASIRRVAGEHRLTVIAGVQINRGVSPEAWEPHREVREEFDVVACLSGFAKPIWVQKHRWGATGWYRGPVQWAPHRMEEGTPG